MRDKFAKGALAIGVLIIVAIMAIVVLATSRVNAMSLVVPPLNDLHRNALLLDQG